MSDNKFARYAGFGSIMAGILWLVLFLVDRAGGSIFNGEFWDYLGILALALVLVSALALYLQGGDERPGTLSLLLLSTGSITLMVSLILYAIEFDSENGAAFGFYFFGIIIMGISLAALGKGFRSSEKTAGWATTLMVLGIFLALVFPASFALFGGILDDAFSDDLAGAIWISAMIVQALGWIVLGKITLAHQGSSVERPVESLG